MNLICKIFGHKIKKGACIIATSDFNCINPRIYCNRCSFFEKHIHKIVTNEKGIELDLNSHLSLLQQVAVLRQNGRI